MAAFSGAAWDTGAFSENAFDLAAPVVSVQAFSDAAFARNIGFSDQAFLFGAVIEAFADTSFGRDTAFSSHAFAFKVSTVVAPVDGSDGWGYALGKHRARHQSDREQPKRYDDEEIVEIMAMLARFL